MAEGALLYFGIGKSVAMSNDDYETLNNPPQGSGNTVQMPSAQDLVNLIAMDPLDYDAVRKECAQTIGVSVTTFDKIVNDHRRKKKAKGKADKKLRPTRGVTGNRTIAVTGGSLSRNATDAEQLLLSENVQIYQKASKLVRPVTEELPASNNRKTKSAALLQVSEAHLRDLLCQLSCCRFGRHQPTLL